MLRSAALQITFALINLQFVTPEIGENIWLSFQKACKNGPTSAPYSFYSFLFLKLVSAIAEKNFQHVHDFHAKLKLHCVRRFRFNFFRFFPRCIARILLLLPEFPIWEVKFILFSFHVFSLTMVVLLPCSCQKGQRRGQQGGFKELWKVYFSYVCPYECFKVHYDPSKTAMRMWSI